MDGMVKVQVLRAACCVAGADGLNEPPERRIVDLLAREVGVGDASLQAMLERATEEDDYYKDQFRVLKSDPKETMALLFSVALADGKLEQSELDVLGRLAQKLGVTDEQFTKWVAEANQLLAKGTSD